MEFILSHLDLSSFSSNEKLLEEIVVDDHIAVQATITCVNTWEYFISTKLDEESGQSINLDVDVRDILATMQATPSLFKSLTNFTLGKFEELPQLVVPTIINHARFTREPHRTIGQPSKLALEQRLFSFILFIKHDNVIKYDAFMWNWNKNAINDNGIFIASCINSIIVDEIHWPTIQQQRILVKQLP